jgi:hypothetical protein
LDDKGQAHLTALGCVIQVERALAIGGNKGIYHGITFPEHHEGVDMALATLQEYGVRITIKS